MPQFPPKLHPGDVIRVIAPASSLKIISDENIRLATLVCEAMGLHVTFGKNVNEEDILHSSSVQSRLDDLHEAFQDKNVKAILIVIGGSNSNSLLKYIDYDLIKQNSKILCGYSDITALQNAIFHKTGLMTYSGPQFSSFAMKKGNEYTIEYFKRALFQHTPISINGSTYWSDDAWYQNQENRIFYENEGYWLIHPGKATGTIIGGNLSTLILLHGTAFMPSPANIILFIESDNITEKHGICEFDRALQSILHQPYFENIKAIIIGRFEKNFGMTPEILKYIIASKKELNHIPIVANVDFGHTMPMFTFPIGGSCSLNAAAKKAEITITTY